MLFTIFILISGLNLNVRSEIFDRNYISLPGNRKKVIGNFHPDAFPSTIGNQFSAKALKKSMDVVLFISLTPPAAAAAASPPPHIPEQRKRRKKKRIIRDTDGKFFSVLECHPQIRQDFLFSPTPLAGVFSGGAGREGLQQRKKKDSKNSMRI